MYVAINMVPCQPALHFGLTGEAVVSTGSTAAVLWPIVTPRGKIGVAACRPPVRPPPCSRI